MRALPILGARPWLSAGVGLLLLIGFVWDGTWGFGRVSTQQRQDYDAARARWQAQHITEYEIKVYRMWALMGESLTLRVRNGQVIDISPRGLLPDQHGSGPVTVEGMFATAKDVLARQCSDGWSPSTPGPPTSDCTRIPEIQYDPTLGYATWMEWGPANSVLYGLRVTDLKILQSGLPNPVLWAWDWLSAGGIWFLVIGIAVLIAFRSRFLGAKMDPPRSFRQP